MVGTNQSFRKVFVTNNNTLLASGTTTALANGQIGIFNAADYVADATPTWPEEKALIIAQGTPDYSNMPKGAGQRNETNKTHIIVGKKILDWKRKDYSAGRTQIMAIGYDGVDTTKNMNGKCDEIKHLYIKLSGKPIEDLFPGGYLLHVEAQGPCCDTCGDNCENVDPTIFRDEFYNRIIEHTFLGGIKFTSYVSVTKTNGTNLAGDPVVGLKFESAFVDRLSDKCYFDLFPYNSEPIIIELSEYDPDWHGDRCASTFPVTELQTVLYPFGSGQWLMRYEAEANRWDFNDYSQDLNVRLARGQYLNTDPSANYDQYSLYFEVSYKVGGFSDVYTDRYILEVFVQTGQTAYRTAINNYISSVPGSGIATV